MKQGCFSAWVERQWYSSSSPICYLAPLSWPFAAIVWLRRKLYSWGIFKTAGPDCPVVIVGNLSVGGTGKTPLIVWLAECFKKNGWKPGIISRGYGGKASSWPQQVRPDSDPLVVGDEAVLIARRSKCPMAVGPNRVQAANSLQKYNQCDIILSDDGLQHYALKRDIEIVVIDSNRLFGNGHFLPIGPMREGIARLSKADLVVYNGDCGNSETEGTIMNMSGEIAVNSGRQDLKVPLTEFSSTHCHAVAGIGNPKRFFDHLKSHGLNFEAHRFPDHHHYVEKDLCFGDDAPILMTEKDAVKCFRFSQKNHWFIPVQAELGSGFEEKLLNLLEN